LGAASDEEVAAIPAIVQTWASMLGGADRQATGAFLGDVALACFKTCFENSRLLGV